MGQFDGKTAVVTGAAGEIGTAMVRRLARDGAQVLAVDLDEERLERLAAGDGGSVHTTPGDVTDSSSVAAYASKAAELGGGRIDLFCNNAGVEGAIGPTESFPEESFDQVMAVNVRGVFLGLKHVLPYMQSGGAIVNTASVAGLIGAGGLVAYIASKHAVLGITKTVALEVAPRGIRVNAICPGPIEGRMMTSIEEGFDIPDAHEVMIAGVPLGRFGKVEEVAAMTAFLLSAEASFSTGGHYVLDGGQTVP